MKKSLRFIHLAFACMAFASSAYAIEQPATPVLSESAYRVATRLPEMDRACEMHISYLRSGDPFVQSLMSSGDDCKKRIGYAMDKAFKSGADACMSSFDPAIRAGMLQNFEEVSQEQNLQCTIRDALIAPCPECSTALRDVKEIDAVLSTQDINNSLNVYVDFDVKEYKPEKRKWVPKQSKLEVLAQQYGCRDFDLAQAIQMVSSYERELTHGAQMVAKRFTRKDVSAISKSKKIPGTDPQYLGSSSGADDDANSRSLSTQNKSSVPNSVTSIELPDGTKSFVYQDPEHKGQSLIGAQIMNPNPPHNKITVAFPISDEDAAKVASSKNPDECGKYLAQAQMAAMKSGITPAIALKNGEKLKDKIAAQMEAQDKAKAAQNSPSGTDSANSDGKNIVNADPASDAGKDSSKPDSTPIQYRVGLGVGPSAGVKIDGTGTGTGLKMGGGTGLRGVQKNQTPSSASTGDSSSQPVQSAAQSTTQSASDQTDHAAGANQDEIARLSNRDSGSEPNGIIDLDSSKSAGKKESASKSPAKKKKKQKTAAAQAQTASDKTATKPSLNVASTKPEAGNAKPEASKAPTSSSSQKPAQQVSAKQTSAQQSSAQKPSSSKQASKGTETARKPAAAASSSSGITFTPGGFGRVRYFLVNRPPFKPYVGRVTEVNGKTQVMMYDTQADSKQLSALSQSSQLLKAEFNKQNDPQAFEARTLMLDPGMSDRAIEDAISQAIRH